MASLLATDTASARGAVADILGLALQTLGALGFGYGIAIYCDWRVALLVTGLLPLLVSGAVIQTRCVCACVCGGGGGRRHQNASVYVWEGGGRYRSASGCVCEGGGMHHWTAGLGSKCVSCAGHLVLGKTPCALPNTSRHFTAADLLLGQVWDASRAAQARHLQCVCACTVCPPQVHAGYVTRQGWVGGPGSSNNRRH